MKHFFNMILRLYLNFTIWLKKKLSSQNCTCKKYEICFIPFCKNTSNFFKINKKASKIFNKNIKINYSTKTKNTLLNDSYIIDNINKHFQIFNYCINKKDKIYIFLSLCDFMINNINFLKNNDLFRQKLLKKINDFSKDDIFQEVLQECNQIQLVNTWINLLNYKSISPLPSHYHSNTHSLT